MARIILTFVFLISVSAKADAQNGFITALEEKFENKLVFYAIDFGKWLENVNDRHLGKSELGRILDYNGTKPKFNDIGSESRGMKKMAMVLLPIIFHVGATSTWLMLTALMAAKSVAIGVILLVFKIAVSSAKVAAFFTGWKHGGHHQEHPWSPQYEHGHYRSIHDAGTHHGSPYLSYNPDWNSEQKTLSTIYIPESYHEIDLKHSIDKKS